MEKKPIQVLVVDDDQDDYFMLQILLKEVQDQRFEMEWASSFDRGVAALLRGSHDVCFLDYRLGAETGLELLKKVALEGCKIPIILLTGYGEHEVDLEAMRVGAADYLIKDQITSALLERSIRYSIHHTQSRESIRSLLDSTFEGIVVHDETGVILEINRMGAQIFNYSPIEMIGTPLIQYLGEESRALFTELASSAGPLSFEASGIKQEGAFLNLELSGKPYQYQGHSVRLTAIRDITRRKEMEAQILMQDRLASVGLLASSLAHEIGTPLGVIRGRAEYLAIQTDGAPQIKKNVDIIVSQIDRVTQLIHSLLNLARGDQNRQLGEINLTQVISEVLDLMGHELRKSSVEIQNHLKLNIPIRVRAEALPLHQVFLNLLVNSVHAIESAIQRGRKSAHWIRISVQNLEDVYLLSLEDSGCGISEKNLKNLFKPFFTTKGIGVGTGLGLATSYRIVESWGGKIQVESQVDVGTVFKLYLPKG